MCILCMSINVSLTGCLVVTFMLYLNDIQARMNKKYTRKK